MDAISTITYMRIREKVRSILYDGVLRTTKEQEDMLLEEVVVPLIEANLKLRKDCQMAQEELRAMAGCRR